MSGFTKVLPPAPLPPPTHRQQWAAIVTADAAVITDSALRGAHGFARNVFVLVVTHSEYGTCREAFDRASGRTIQTKSWALIGASWALIGV